MMKEHLKAIHDNTIQKLLCFNNVGEFANKVKEVIEFIYKNSTARLHPFFYPYAESFITNLDVLSKSLMKEIQFQEVGSYFTLSRNISLRLIPLCRDALRGVQVLDSWKREI